MGSFGGFVGSQVKHPAPGTGFASKNQTPSFTKSIKHRGSQRNSIQCRSAQEGDVVHVHYTVYPDRPSERERGFTRHAGAAVNFTLGALKSRQLDLKAIESAVQGLKVGSRHTVELPPIDKTKTQDGVFSIPKNDDQVSYLQSRGRRGRTLKPGAIVSLEDGSQVEVVDATGDDVVFRALNAIAILHTGRAAVLELQLVGIGD